MTARLVETMLVALAETLEGNTGFYAFTALAGTAWLMLLYATLTDIPDRLVYLILGCVAVCILCCILFVWVTVIYG